MHKKEYGEKNDANEWSMENGEKGKMMMAKKVAKMG
jgi:hypothetical protein